MANHENARCPAIEINCQIQASQDSLSTAVILTNLTPTDANPSIRRLKAAFRNQFGAQTIPESIIPFRSDFVARFASIFQKQTVLDSGIIYDRSFAMTVVPWSPTYGGNTVNWETLISVDIQGIPPHTYHPKILKPLLSPYCSIQAYTFNEAKGICRVHAYSLDVASIPSTGHVGVQYPNLNGATNILFPVTMTSYLYEEAPPFEHDDQDDAISESKSSGSTPFNHADNHLDYDEDVLREAFEDQCRANDRVEFLRRKGYGGYLVDDGFSCTSSSSDDPEQPFYLPRDYSPGTSIESDRSWKL